MSMQRNKYATQGRLLIDRLKRRPHTYLDMLRYGVSTSPWKRVAECLRHGEQLVKAPDSKGRTTWRVVKA
jgi:uncharacterized protein YerC